MTDIEKKALEQAVAAAGRRMRDYAIMAEGNLLRQSIEAHARAIEQHEAFKREVSDALKGQFIGGIPDKVARFIITEADEVTAGLALAVEETLELVIGDEDAKRLRAAIEARGGRIVWEGEDA